VRIAIVGSRDYPDMRQVVRHVCSLPEDTVIVSGGARGVDTVAVETAKLIGLKTCVYPADWDRYGKKAGFVRNHTIVENADRIFAFWDGKSRGTSHTIWLARQEGKTIHVIRPDGSVE
jgi:hypothetical protein